MCSHQILGSDSAMPTLLPTIKLQGKHFVVINLKHVSSSTIYLPMLKYLFLQAQIANAYFSWKFLIIFDKTIFDRN